MQLSHRVTLLEVPYSVVSAQMSYDHCAQSFVRTHFSATDVLGDSIQEGSNTYPAAMN